ncbi:MAG: hypothetical protein ACPHID_04075 [Thermoplasmatota archaeon]
MAEKTVRYGWVWIVFLAVTFTGAGLMFSESPDDDWLGLGLIVLPLIIMGALMALYYWKSRQI